eukprot:UN19852
MANAFNPYYEHFIPVFKNELEKLMPEPRLTGLQGKCLEAIGICGFAVGKEIFVNDASELMNMLLPNYGSYDDALAPYVMAFFGRIAKVIGEEFALAT